MVNNRGGHNIISPAFTGESQCMNGSNTMIPNDLLSVRAFNNAAFNNAETTTNLSTIEWKEVPNFGVSRYGWDLTNKSIQKCW